MRVQRPLVAIAIAVALAFTIRACDGGSTEGDQTATSTETGAAPSPTSGAGAATAVGRHVDGDTFVTAAGEKVRLIGIDTPETVDPRKPVQCFGKQASNFIAELLPIGTAIRLDYDVERFDRYGRTLAYVYRARDGLFVNAELVRRGFAHAYTVPPDVAHSDEFVSLEREAREQSRGLWKACVAA